MSSFVNRLIAWTPVGAAVELPGAGTSLENVIVYDSAAREIEQVAAQGRVEIVNVQFGVVGDQRLISRLVFKRLR